MDIEGLNNYFVSHPVLPKATSFPNDGSGTNGSYQGYDFRNAYLPNDTLSGYGQIVGLFEMDGYYLSDIHSYEDGSNLPHVPMQNILLDNLTGQPNTVGGDGEVSLDIEVAAAMAPYLKKIVVFEGNNWTDILNSMEAHPEIHQLSCSWGDKDTSSSHLSAEHTIFDMMGVQGQTFFLASGDGDAFVSDLMVPDDDTLITTVGGTELTMNGQGASFASETVWNHGYYANNKQWYTGKYYWGSSGGISTRTSIPSWQQSVDMSSNQGSTTMRNVPDVSMVADGVWAIYWNGQYKKAVMGTSIAAPLWASFTALVNEQGETGGLNPIGFLNPALYYMGKTNGNTDFHDITVGNNEWPDSPNKFSAEPGYDLCTGWGSPNGQTTIQALLDYEARQSAPILSTSITSNTTLSGKYYRVDQNVLIDGSSTLTIPSGVHLFFAPGKEITVQPGSKIIANGTSSQPIRFERLDPTQAWGQVYMNGSGNQFTWCLFDGGNKNVGILSKNNTFSNCTFRNGWRGISSGANNDGSGGSSSFTLNNCMIEDNSTVGVVAYHDNPTLYNTTIQHSGSAGLWLYDAAFDEYSPGHNAILNNNTDQVDNGARQGMEINGGSDVSMIDGVNEIEDNPNYQILVDPSSTLTMGDAGTSQEGDNSVFAASGNSNYLVYNESSTSVDAYGNWWGTANPSSSLFYGPIDYSGSLYYDPCGIIGCGVQSGQYPQHMAPSSPEPMLVRGVSKETSPEVQMSTSPSKTSSVSLASNQTKLRARMHTLWGEIAQASDGQSLMKETQELYMLHLVSYKDSSFSSERKQDRTLWDGMIRNYLNGSPITGANEITLSAAQAERLMLMDEHEAYRFGRYAEAQKKVTEYAPYISSARGKIAHMTDQMNLLDVQGSYKQELALLDKVEQAEVSLGEPAKQVAARYQIAQENIQEALNLKMAGSNGAVGNLSDSVASVKPTRTALNANYPNPFNPTTIISYQLAQSGHIRLTVWNILGRRVATLVDANQQKGIHEVSFNASQLSSGVYFYRLQSGNKVLVKKMLLMK